MLNCGRRRRRRSCRGWPCRCGSRPRRDWSPGWSRCEGSELQRIRPAHTNYRDQQHGNQQNDDRRRATARSRRRRVVTRSSAVSPGRTARIARRWPARRWSARVAGRRRRRAISRRRRSITLWRRRPDGSEPNPAVGRRRWIWWRARRRWRRHAHDSRRIRSREWSRRWHRRSWLVGRRWLSSWGFGRLEGWILRLVGHGSSLSH